MVGPAWMLRAWAIVALVGTAGCTSIALDYTSDAGAPDASAEAAADAAPAMMGVDAGSGPPCPCDASAGMGCCILGGSASPFCTADGVVCTNASGVYSACQGYDPLTESQCCWNGSPAAGGSTHYASACGERAASCAQQSDCPVGQSCQTTTCNGTVLGACGVMPICP
jgi:hypothetical protein